MIFLFIIWSNSVKIYFKKSEALFIFRDYFTLGCAGGKPFQSAIQISKILSQEMIGYRNKQKTKLFKPWIIPFILKDQTETSANRAGIVKITNVRILLETNSTLISDQQGSGNGFNFGSIRFLLTCFN